MNFAGNVKKVERGRFGNQIKSQRKDIGYLHYVDEGNPRTHPKIQAAPSGNRYTGKGCYL